MTSFFICLES